MFVPLLLVVDLRSLTATQQLPLEGQEHVEPARLLRAASGEDRNGPVARVVLCGADEEIHVWQRKMCVQDAECNLHGSHVGAVIGGVARRLALPPVAADHLPPVISCLWQNFRSPQQPKC